MEQETGKASFKLSRNAKGETQIEVKTYALGETTQDEEDARKRAAEHFEALRQEYPL